MQEVNLNDGIYMCKICFKGFTQASRRKNIHSREYHFTRVLKDSEHFATKEASGDIHVLEKAVYKCVLTDLHNLAILSHIGGYIQVKSLTSVRCVLKDVHFLATVRTIRGAIQGKSQTRVNCVLNI